MTLQLEIGLQSIANYRRMDYEIWYALAEYVDNSTQSYFNNRETLDTEYAKTDESLRVDITYDRDGENSILRIVDNATGMSYEELRTALRVATPPAIRTGRCKYGMGMKTASCWIGNIWTVKTKKLGETSEYKVTVNVEKIANGEASLPTETIENLEPNDHYTIIEIYSHNREFKGRTVGKIKDHLRSMYRVDLSNGTLLLTYNATELIWEDLDERLRKNKAGELMKQKFEFEIAGKNINGWAGILEKGRRADAGFSILHSNRVVKGWPNAWRPEKIFGQQRNDLLNQRLVGEIHLDDFDVTHTKDNIQWYGDEEELVEGKLAEKIPDLIQTAKTTWKGQEDEGGPAAGDVDLALDAMREELLSKEMIDQIEIDVLPPEEAVNESFERISDPVKSSRVPTINANLGEFSVWVYVVGDMSPNDPYVVAETGEGDKVIVIINMRHPHVASIEGSDGVMNYFRHCIYDAIAEWQARQKAGRIDPNTIKLLKDKLLRVSMSIEEHAVEQDSNDEAVA